MARTVGNVESAQVGRVRKAEKPGVTVLEIWESKIFIFEILRRFSPGLAASGSGFES